MHGIVVITIVALVLVRRRPRSRLRSWVDHPSRRPRSWVEHHWHHRDRRGWPRLRSRIEEIASYFHTRAVAIHRLHYIVKMPSQLAASRPIFSGVYLTFSDFYHKTSDCRLGTVTK